MYDAAYLQEYEARAKTALGQAIYAERWRLVRKYCTGGTLLDYGCASGAFHLSGEGFDCHGYDINPSSPYKWRGPVDILTMWDVIEHLPYVYEPFELCRPQFVFLSTPNVEAATDVQKWKHFKPGEHLYYFSPKSMEAILACAGYRILEMNIEEGRLRDPHCPDAIISIAARRNDA